MVTEQFHHINYLVHNLNQSIDYFSKLFNQNPVIESLPQRGVETARFDLQGIFFILVQPTTNNSVVAETLADKGEGVFLLSFAVNDLASSIDKLSLDNIPVDQASFRTGLDGWSVCDLEPPSPGRTTIQLCQEKQQ